jgi:hypothetical protein
MPSETSTEAKDGPAPRPARRSRILLWIVCVGAVATIAILALITTHSSEVPDLVWLSGRAIPPAKKATAWSKFRLKVIQFTYPVWRRFRTPPPTICVESLLMRLPDENNRSFESTLGRAISTNAAGVRAWILSAEQLKAVQDTLQTIPNVTTIARPRLTTSSGTDAQIFTGSNLDHFSVHLSPKLVGRSIRLGIGGEWVEALNVATTNTLACRVLVPNGGALVVGGFLEKPGVKWPSWALFTATAIDGKTGKPLKL